MKNIKFKGVEYEALSEIYQNLITLVGSECAEKLYDFYRGQQITFPVRIYSSDYIKRVLTEQGENCDSKALARTLGCTERWIKELAKEVGRDYTKKGS